MNRPALEVADVFRAYGPSWRDRHAGHLSLGQLKAMSAIERCRSEALGGHKLYCQSCECTQIAYNSCRDRHCPKCQASSAKRWLEARQANLLPIDYFHLVFTLPSTISQLAYYNKSLLYGLLMRITAATLQTIAADPKHLGAQIGMTLMLHTWGSAMPHHPHAHGIVPGGGLSLDGERWVNCRPKFFLPVRVLSRLFRRLFLDQLLKIYQAGQLQFFGEQASLKAPELFTRWIGSLRQIEWVVYAKRPFAGPEAVLKYLSQYTHRVAIANSRLIKMDDDGVTFKYKDYRLEGPKRYSIMTLTADEFMHRFLLHILPKGFHHIRHYGLFSNGKCKESLVQARKLLQAPQPSEPPSETADAHHPETPEQTAAFICPECGGPMIVTELIPCKPFSRAPPLTHE